MISLRKLVGEMPWKLAELYFTNLISSAICGWFLQFTGIADETIKPLPCSPCSYWRPPLYGPSHSFTRWRPPCCFLRPTNVNLVGGWPTPLKNMKISWDDDIPNIWKVIKFHCSKPPTSNYSYYHVISPQKAIEFSLGLHPQLRHPQKDAPHLVGWNPQSSTLFPWNLMHTIFVMPKSHEEFSINQGSEGSEMPPWSREANVDSASAPPGADPRGTVWPGHVLGQKNQDFANQKMGGVMVPLTSIKPTINYPWLEMIEISFVVIMGMIYFLGLSQ